MRHNTSILTCLILLCGYHLHGQVQDVRVKTPTSFASGTQADPIAVSRYQKIELELQLNETGLFARQADRYAYEEVRGILTDPNGDQRVVHLFYTQDYKDQSTNNFDGLDDSIKDTRDAPCHDNVADDPNDPNDEPWVLQPTTHPWRLRFAFKIGGFHRIEVEERQNGSWVATGDEFHFRVSTSQPAGRLTFDPISGYLQNERGQSIILAGQQSGYYWQHGGSFAEDHTDYPRATLCYYREYIRRLKAGGGNFFRILLHPGAIDLEWVEAGNYTAYLNRASDLDEILRMCEQQGVYVQLAVYDHTPLHNDGGGYNWDDHPYNDTRIKSHILKCKRGVLIPSKWEQYRFFSPHGIALAKRKVRYILARWGYSPNLLSLEMGSEQENVNDSNGPGEPYECNSQIRWAVSQWYEEVAAYSKQVEPEVMVTTGTAKYAATDGRIFTNPDADYNIFHHYSNHRNYPHAINSTVNHIKSEFGKPVQLGEMGMSGKIGDASVRSRGGDDPKCINQDVRLTSIHNALWSTALSGSFMAGVPWWNNRLHATWINPRGWMQFKPLTTFFKKEELVGHQWEHFQNNCQYDPYPDFRTHNKQNKNSPCYPAEKILNKLTGITYDEDYFDDLLGPMETVTTTNESHLAVFGIKRPGKTLGWIHYKDHYWFAVGSGLTHWVDNGIVKYVGCEDYLWDNYDPKRFAAGFVPPFTPGATYQGKDPQSESLTGEQMTLTDLDVHGNYEISWWHTWPGGDYDDSHDNIPASSNIKGGEGMISSTTAHSILSNGNISLTIDIPELRGIRARNVPADVAPDYGFKVKLITPKVHIRRTGNFGPATMCEGDIASFLNTVNVDGGAAVNVSHIAYNWSVSPTGMNIIGNPNAQDVSLEATSPGTYQVYLQVTVDFDFEGQSYQQTAGLTQWVTVQAQPCNGGGGPNEEQRAGNDFAQSPRIIPNPGSAETPFVLDIPWKTTEAVEVRVTDLSGKTVYQAQLPTGFSKIQLREAPGVYLVSIRTPSHRWHGKIVIQ